MVVIYGGQLKIYPMCGCKQSTWEMILQGYRAEHKAQERVTKWYKGPRTERDCGYANENCGSIKADDLTSS